MQLLVIHFSQFIAIFDSSEAQHSTPYNIFVDDGEATSQWNNLFG